MTKNQINQRHMDALPILIEPLKRVKYTGVRITPDEAKRILAQWDKARK